MINSDERNSNLQKPIAISGVSVMLISGDSNGILFTYTWKACWFLPDLIVSKSETGTK